MTNWHNFNSFKKSKIHFDFHLFSFSFHLCSSSVGGCIFLRQPFLYIIFYHFLIKLKTLKIKKKCKMKYFIIILSLLICVNLINCTKLNYPRVLLPIFDKLSINFTLEVVEKGCFKWWVQYQKKKFFLP